MTSDARRRRDRNRMLSPLHICACALLNIDAHINNENSGSRRPMKARSVAREDGSREGEGNENKSHPNLCFAFKSNDGRE